MHTGGKRSPVLLQQGCAQTKIIIFDHFGQKQPKVTKSDQNAHFVWVAFIPPIHLPYHSPKLFLWENRQALILLRAPSAIAVITK
jgi:hypothetical protein